jgi:ATP-dependent RNA helicase SUPV3L1/SUV3
VLVEGHHVGELQGFRFTADQSAGGEDAKAVRAAAQKALAAEFEARADRFATCANGDLALASDGTLRWIGAPIGTLVSGDDPLKPRVVLLADEQLTGPARDKVAARADRYVEYQINSLLKPLVDLKGAETLSGIARGIAFQLVENFGTLNRRDIAEEMKSLDQEGRAALRRLGVRFGAYHIFVPTLLKPGPAGLITLLWALGHDGKDKAGFGDVVNGLAAGRTSIVVDQAFERTFYKLAGFRVLGRRAVRIDILERLADLIRPALAWKPGQGQRPDGAYDGNGFIVTPPMMSILGATADDVEEILKGLGYRSDAKPAADVRARLAELDEAVRRAAEAAAQAAAEARARAAAEQAAALQAEAAAGEDAALALEEPGESDEAGASRVVLPESAQTAGEQAAHRHHGDEAVVQHADLASEPEAVAAAELQAEAAAGEDAALHHEEVPGAQPAEAVEEAAAEVEIDAAQAAAAVEPQLTAAEATDAAGEPVSSEAAPSQPSAEPAEEPKPILIWRPARFDHRPRHRHEARGRGREANRPGEVREGERAPGQRRHGDHRGESGRPQPGEGERATGKERFEKKFGKPRRDDGGGRGDGKQRQGREAFGDRKKGGNGGERQKTWSTEKPREERAPRFDPNSPFAKLAALRDQLKK